MTQTEIFSFVVQTLYWFFLYGCIGWGVEVVYAAIKERRLVNRGFLCGPICPIYGCGMVVLNWTVAALTPSGEGKSVSTVAVFFVGMVLTTAIELVGGWTLFKIYHIRWWDYSNMKFNIGGYICPQFSLLWGLGSVIMVKVVHPALAKASSPLPMKVLVPAEAAVLALFVVDLIVSAAAATGLNKKLKEIDEVRARLRVTSDKLTTVLGVSAMTADTILDEQKLQLALAKLEGRENAAELKLEMLLRANEMRAKLRDISVDKMGTRRLLRAFPDMKSLTYAETLEAFRDAGAEVVFFSPLRDTALPENIGGLYLPGGYPELHAKELSENTSLLREIKQKIESGLPTAAECGGFLYLGQSLTDAEGQSWPMAGVLPGEAKDAGRLVRFGYAALSADSDSMLFRAGESFPIHEFHHWDSTANGVALAAKKPVGGAEWRCGFIDEHFYAGFPHLYWAGTPLPERFVAAAESYQNKRGSL